jgi:hypothetical protein
MDWECSQVIGFDQLALRVPEMRYRLLLSTATMMCCGFCPFVSAQNSLTASPTLAPQLHLTQDSNSDQAATEPDDSASSRPSPFDIFSDDSASSRADKAADSNFTNSSNNATEPTNTTPVAQQHHSANPADTIIAGSQAIAHNYFTPMEWPGARGSAPNHTANYMLNQWCADGLWDNYHAERAAQCARQYQRIAGKHHCGSAGCQQPTSCGHAGHCGILGPAKNFRHAVPTSQQPQTNCDCAQATSQGTSAQPAQYAQVNPNGRPMPANLPAPQDATIPGKVAFQPLELNR